MNPLDSNVHSLSTHHKTESSTRGKSRVGKSKEAPEREKKVSIQTAKLSKVHEAPEIRPHTSKGEKKVSLYDQVPEFQKKVDAFIHGIKTDKLDKKEIAAFHKYLKNQRLPMTEQQLNEIKAVVAPKENHYHNDSKITKIIELSAKLRTALGKTVDIQDIEKNEALKARSSPLWECIDRIQNETGGYSYVFRARDEYDNVTKHPDLEKRKMNTNAKVTELYPAIDAKPSEMALFNTDLTDEARFNLLRETFEAGYVYDPNLDLLGLKPDFFKMVVKPQLELNLHAYNQIIQLGFCSNYKKDGVFMTIPDEKTLLVRWEKLRETDPKLPQLTLASSEGIADDVSFVESFFKDDILISNEKEFVHDMTLHALKTLALVLTKEVKSQIFEVILDKSNGVLSIQKKEATHTNDNERFVVLNEFSSLGNPSFKTARTKLIKKIANDFSRIQTFKKLLEKNPQLVSSDKMILNELDKLTKFHGLKNNLGDLFRDPKRTNEMLAQFDKLLGALVDTITTQDQFLLISSLIDSEGSANLLVLDVPQWKTFFEKNFGDKMLSKEELSFCLGVMDLFVKERK